MDLRLAFPDEADAIADVWLRSRKAATPAIPSPVHTDDEVRAWFSDVVLPTAEVWVVASEDTPVALMVLTGDWVDQLYVDVGRNGEGIGSRLVRHAKVCRPEGLQLWTFQANTGARRFYERHGFIEVERTDGDNEEGAPDVRYQWRRS